ncbi:DUF4468 domain-containing protein [Solitalea sp. MAHUQ-68]|uniref:DUF4468 domain-containing protein n=1 Tax=Solitalea agri TaxID=2953739 RepID=A0A9X2F4M7_9SPHI|nr:DUF4468 domain-containing protein [Solitalea agri]MCO4294124.1 DUF4468 domain-containing protein [Solitalea agri]
MKTRLLFSLLLCSFYFISSPKAHSQQLELPMQHQKVVYSDTVFVNGVSKDTLFARAKHWILKTFPAQNKTFSETNRTDSLIEAKGFLEFSQMDLYNLNTVIIEYKIHIDLYENAYAYKIDRFGGKLYEKSQYTSNSAAMINIEEDYSNYLKNKRSTDYTRRVKQFYKLINQQLDSFNAVMEPTSDESYQRGPHLE